MVVQRPKLADLEAAVYIWYTTRIAKDISSTYTELRRELDRRFEEAEIALNGLAQQYIVWMNEDSRMREAKPEVAAKPYINEVKNAAGETTGIRID
jgi:hypothetical protein